MVTTSAVPYALHNVNSYVSEIEDINKLCEYTLKALSEKGNNDILLENAFNFANEHSLKSSLERFVECAVARNA